MSDKTQVRNKGSIVVEAALLFPIILLCIMAVIFIGILIYQKAYVQSLADTAAVRGADIWSNPAKDMALGSVDKNQLNAGGLYWRIVDGRKGEKKSIVSGYVKDRLKKFSLLKSNRSSVDTQIVDYVVYKKLVVKIKDTYYLPMGKLLKPFGLDESYTVEAASEAVILEPAEFIRSTDMALDMQKGLERDNPGLAAFGDKFRNMMDGILNNINKLFGASGGE